MKPRITLLECPPDNNTSRNVCRWGQDFIDPEWRSLSVGTGGTGGPCTIGFVKGSSPCLLDRDDRRALPSFNLSWADAPRLHGVVGLKGAGESNAPPE